MANIYNEVTKVLSSSNLSIKEKKQCLTELCGRNYSIQYSSKTKTGNAIREFERRIGRKHEILKKKQQEACSIVSYKGGASQHDMLYQAASSLKLSGLFRISSKEMPDDIRELKGIFESALDDFSWSSNSYKHVKKACITVGRRIARIPDLKAKLTRLQTWLADYKEAKRIEKEQQERERVEEAERGYAFLKKYGVSERNVEPLLTASKEDAVILGDYAFQSYEDVDVDWNYYSKSYGHPKVTVTGRGIYVYKKGKQVDKIELDSFRGNWFIDSIAAYLKLEAPKVSKDLRKFQVTKWTDVKRSVCKDGYQTYKLMFGKWVVGYVAYNKVHDIHYHDNTLAEAIAGLNRKIAQFEEERKEEEKQASKVWTAKQLNARFGFCWQGMTEFAEACGINRDEQYSVAQLRAAIKNISDNYVLTKYRRELRMINVLTK